MTTLEQKAREAAIDHGLWLAPDDDETNYQSFVAGYLRGHSDMAADTTNALDELDDWRESARKAIEEPCGDEKHCACVGPMRHQLVRQAQRVVEADEEIAALTTKNIGLTGYVERRKWEEAVLDEKDAEIAALRARVAELEGMVPKWVWDAEELEYRDKGWHCLGSKWVGSRTASLMVPPIPLPEVNSNNKGD